MFLFFFLFYTIISRLKHYFIPILYSSDDRRHLKLDLCMRIGESVCAKWLNIILKLAANEIRADGFEVYPNQAPTIIALLIFIRYKSRKI